MDNVTTLAKFVSQHADEIEELFAIDGCKMSSNAAKDKTTKRL